VRGSLLAWPEGVENGEDAGEAHAEEVVAPPPGSSSSSSHLVGRLVVVALLHAAAASGSGRPARAQDQGLRVPADWEDTDGLPEQGHRGMRRPDRGQARVPAAVLQRQRQASNFNVGRC